MEKAAINRIILILPEEREILFQNRRTRRLDLAVRLVEKSQFLVFDPLSHYERPPISGKGCVYLSISWLEMGAGLKKDLRVSRVGPGGSLNAFFFLLIGVISQRLAMVRKKGGTSTLGERSTTESCMLRSGRMNHSRKGIYWFSPNWLDRRCDDLLHGRGLWFKSRMAQLRQGKE